MNQETFAQTHLKSSRPKIVVLNGSLGGQTGNSARLIEALRNTMGDRSELEEVTLSDWMMRSDLSALEGILSSADGVIFVTGTYWDSWGSPMQSFFERATQWEASSIWMGKPAAVLVLMHSVGGKGVLSRLQGVLNTLGMALPPMSGAVLSLVNQLALSNSQSEHSEDFWQVHDLPIVLHNLLEHISGGRNWQSWPVDGEDPHRPWFLIDCKDQVS